MYINIYYYDNFFIFFVDICLYIFLYNYLLFWKEEVESGEWMKRGEEFRKIDFLYKIFLY